MVVVVGIVFTRYRREDSVNFIVATHENVVDERPTSEDADVTHFYLDNMGQSTGNVPAQRLDDENYVVAPTGDSLLYATPGPATPGPATSSVHLDDENYVAAPNRDNQLYATSVSGTYEYEF